MLFFYWKCLKLNRVSIVANKIEGNNANYLFSFIFFSSLFMFYTGVPL